MRVSVRARPVAAMGQRASLRAASTMAQHLMATIQHFHAVIPLTWSPSDMIIRRLFEQLRWVWSRASGDDDTSSANAAVNYH